MDRRAWRAMIHGSHKESDITWIIPASFNMKGFTIILQSINEGKEGMGWGLAREETRRPPKPQSLDCCFSFSCKKSQKILIRKTVLCQPGKKKKKYNYQEWKFWWKVKIMVEVKLKSKWSLRPLLFLEDFCFLLTWIVFEVFIEFVTILLLFHVLAFWPRGMWDLSSPTRGQTWTLCFGRQSLNHWTTREVLKPCYLNMYMLCAKSLQLCLILCDPMDCSPPGSSVHGILQARILEQVAISFSRGSSQPRDWTREVQPEKFS